MCVFIYAETAVIWSVHVTEVERRTGGGELDLGLVCTLCGSVSACLSVCVCARVFLCVNVPAFNLVADKLHQEWKETRSLFLSVGMSRHWLKELKKNPLNSLQSPATNKLSLSKFCEVESHQPHQE